MGVRNIIEVKGVSKSYQNHQALNNIDLKVKTGRVFGLLGPNGAGKTTLIRIINQILEADSGSIRINGELLSHEHIYSIGYLPEERGLYKKMKVGEQSVYLAQLNNNVWITQYTNTNQPYHRVNPHSNKLSYINHSIQNKLLYPPIPHYFNTMYIKRQIYHVISIKVTSNGYHIILHH